ncbi:MAG: hypothetical protein R3175_17480, partial [Marinobacter sp.]|uniref:hypothetical protein n=1 Tax=Marinobacter sp. TaxID=50741 RepID=UPI00299D52E3
FRATAIGPLPESPKKRTRIGEELQPIGAYAGIIPYLGTIQDVEALQDKEKDNWDKGRRPCPSPPFSQ